MFRASTHLTNARRFFNCISSTVYRCPYSHAVLNADGRVYAVTCVHLFPHTSLCTFSHLRFPFFCFLFFILSFFHSTFSLSHLYAHFGHRPQHFSSARFNRCDYPPVSFSFHSPQSLRNLRLLTTHIPPYSPRVVVLILILSTLGWCPLNVISNKMSVFLSTDSQSTGSLTFKSHVPVFALLSPLIHQLPPSLGDIISAFCRKRVLQCPN